MYIFHSLHTAMRKSKMWKTNRKFIWVGVGRGAQVVVNKESENAQVALSGVFEFSLGKRLRMQSSAKDQPIRSILATQTPLGQQLLYLKTSGSSLLFNTEAEGYGWRTL